MTFTYTHYMFNRDLERRITNNEITVIAIVRMDLGCIVHFTCENEEVLHEIFGNED